MKLWAHRGRLLFYRQKKAYDTVSAELNIIHKFILHK